MSMELYLLFAMQDAPNRDEWNRALSERSIPVLITVDADLRTHSGFLPMRLESKDTGLYFLIDDYAELAAQFPPIKEVSIENPVVYSLGFGGHLDEAAVVFYSAYVLSVAFNGIAFEPQGGTLMDAELLLESARHVHEMAGTQ
jgi:hypothetical protein